MIDLLKVAGSFIAAFVAIFLAIRKRELFRPSLRLLIGAITPCDFTNTPRRLRGKPTHSLMYLLDVPRDAYGVVGFWFRVENSGLHALRKVHIQLMFPDDCLLTDDATHSLGDDSIVWKVPQNKSSDVTRTCSVLGGTARVSFNIELLRPGETFTGVEPLKFDCEAMQQLENSERRPGVLLKRLQSIPTFVNYLSMGMYVHCENAPQRKQLVDVYAFRHKRSADLGGILKKLETAIWNGEAPQAGDVYYNPWPLPRLLETVVLQTVVPSLEPIHPRVFQERLFASEELAISTLRIPSWDFRHESRAHHEWLRLRRNQNAKQYVRTNLRQKRDK